MPEEHDRRHNKGYDCWLNYGEYAKDGRASAFERYFSAVFLPSDGRVLKTAAMELLRAARGMFGLSARIYTGKPERPHIAVRVKPELSASLGPEGYAVTINEYGIDIAGTDQNGALYGVFELLRSIGCGRSPDECTARRRRGAELRIVEHWDNISGEIERGYAGKSVFFRDNEVISDLSRAGDYARLLASVGINAVCINNVNVHRTETLLVTERYLPDIARLAEVLRLYGIRLFMSVNFAAPAEIGGLPDADPLNPEVGRWWAETAALIYSHIPDFGGFIVKADSENRPGPFTYGRDHAQGANMLARALKPYGGLVIWRCFVYDCHLDWRDRSTDRAMAAYQHFFPLDGRFEDNAVLQIKNGPMDFQVREPVSPLFGALEKTNAAIEFQITQEYTGQQKHVCYLVPMWKEALDFDTYAKGQGSTVLKAVDGSLSGTKHGGIAGVSNVGDDENWCGHPLAQANLYGFGRLAFDPSLSAGQIAREWVSLTFGRDSRVMETVAPILLESREIYEMYTAPLGVGWMVKPGFHYGPDVDGYEYSEWGTYHYADHQGIGVDRTQKTGTGFTAQYREPVSCMYEDISTCPDELLLFFHHVPYGHRLKSGKTVLQHIYDTHFEGAERAAGLLERWRTLKGLIDPIIFEEAERRFMMQLESAGEWRDVINTYFYRKTGIGDLKNRKIYR